MATTKIEIDDDEITIRNSAGKVILVISATGGPDDPLRFITFDGDTRIYLEDIERDEWLAMQKALVDFSNSGYFNQEI